MAQKVTFITVKVNSGCGLHNQNPLFADKRNVLSQFWDLDFVTLEVCANSKVQKVSPKGIDWQRKSAEITNSRSGNDSKRHVYHLKSYFWLWIWQSNTTFLPILRSCHFGGTGSQKGESGNGEVHKVSPKAIDWQTDTAKWQYLDLKMPPNVTLITTKLERNLVVNLTIKIHLFTDDVTFGTMSEI